ncbi:UNVERIFIED_CONTAM: hypothetical protein ABIE34_001927 [Jeotgalibacillus campisalis]
MDNDVYKPVDKVNGIWQCMCQAEPESKHQGVLDELPLPCVVLAHVSHEQRIRLAACSLHKGDIVSETVPFDVPQVARAGSSD